MIASAYSAPVLESPRKGAPTQFRAWLSPIGPLRLAATGTHLVGLAVGPAGSSASAAPEPAADATASVNASAMLERAVRQLSEFFDGRRRAFDLPLAAAGTPFQRRIWTALLDLPFGARISYRELAHRCGHPGAERAVGTAVGRNPLCLWVPCHRVVRSDGTLGGYSGGLDAKAALLRLEAEVAGTPAARPAAE